MTPNSIPTNRTNADGPTNAIADAILDICYSAVSTIEELGKILENIEKIEVKRKNKKKYGSGGKLLKKHDFFNR